MVDTDAVRRATAKIERAVGDAGAGGVAVEVSRQEQATTAAVREALEAGRALRIRYYTAGRDDVTRRTVDPMRLLLVEGRGYLEAWCRRAGAVRLFRLDRVDDVAVLDEPAAAPPDAAPTDLSGGVFPARARARQRGAAARALGAVGGRVLPGGAGRGDSPRAAPRAGRRGHRA